MPIPSGRSNGAGRTPASATSRAAAVACDTKSRRNRTASAASVDAEGNWIVRDDVWITWDRENRDDKQGRLTIGFGCDGETIGPEFGFGHPVGDALDEPVLLVKAVWGGKSLVKDFRPPTAVARRDGEIGPYYTTMLNQVREAVENLGEHFPELAGRKVEITGFGWHQGWNDGCNTDMTNEYEQNMADFIRDVRKELGEPDLPFVIAGSGFGGENLSGRRLQLLQAQLAMSDAEKYPQFQGTVAAIDTRPFHRWRVPAFGQGYHWHWNGETHYLIGEAMGRAMVELLNCRKASGG